MAGGSTPSRGGGADRHREDATVVEGVERPRAGDFRPPRFPEPRQRQHPAGVPRTYPALPPQRASRSASTRRTIAVRTRRGGSSSRRTVSGWRGRDLTGGAANYIDSTSKSRKHSTEFREVLTKNFPLFLGCVSELMSRKDENNCTLIKDKKAHWLTS